MKKIFSLMLAVIMVLSLTVGLTACGNDEQGTSSGTDNSETASSGDSNNNSDGATGTSDKTSTFSLNEISFTVQGDFMESGAREDVIAIKNGNFSVSVNYNGETSYTTQEEAVRSTADAITKYNADSTVEVLEKNGVFYYSEKTDEYNILAVEYIVNGISISVITSNFSDEAIDVITSIEFN